MGNSYFIVAPLVFLFHFGTLTRGMFLLVLALAFLGAQTKTS